MERRLLQLFLATIAVIPVTAGLAMVVGGPHFLDITTSISADSHLRYLSGLLFGIGVAVWTIIPNIERNGRLLRTITLVVVAGGLARLWSLVHVGLPNMSMLLALGVELVLTPALYLWQRRVAQHARDDVDR